MKTLNKSAKSLAVDKCCCGSDARRSTNTEETMFNFTCEEKKRMEEIMQGFDDIDKKQMELSEELNNINKRARYDRFKEIEKQYQGKCVCDKKKIFYGRIVKFNMDSSGNVNYVEINGFNPEFDTTAMMDRWDDKGKLIFTYNLNASDIEFISDEVYNHMFQRFMEKIQTEIPELIRSWRETYWENLRKCYEYNGFTEEDIYKFDCGEKVCCDEEDCEPCFERTV